MAYQPITNVQITISDVQISVAGFGTPLFYTTHRKHENRVESYLNAAEVGTAYGTDSAAYRAALKCFGQSPSIDIFKVGRRDGELRLVPTGVAESVTYNFDVVNKAGVIFTASYTAVALDTEVEVVAALAAAITGDAGASEDCVAVANGTQLVLKTAGAGGTWQDSYFTITNDSGNFSGIDRWYGTEPAADLFQRVTEEDNDFYFQGADDNTQAFVLGASGMAATVETVDKLYFVSDANEANFGTIEDPDNTLFGKLSVLNYLNTVSLSHQLAGDSDVASAHETADYPEMAYIGANAVYPAGSVSWSNISLAGVPATTSVTTGKKLTSTQKNNLETRNANYIEYDAGDNFVRNGITVSGEWIDVVRGVHWQTADLGAELKALLRGQKGSKLTYDDSGIARVFEVVSTSLQRGVNRKFLSSFSVKVPRVADISGTQRNTRILENVTFEGILAGAIHIIKVDGRVSSGQ